MIRPWLEGNRNGFDVRKLAHIARLKARIGWQNLRTEEFVDEGPFCVTGTDFNNGEVNWNTSYHVSLERYEIDKNIQLQEDDLLITKDGTIGKVAVVRGMPGLATLNSGVFLLRSIGEGVHSPYMKWVIQSKVFADFVTYNSTGSTINHLYQNVFEQFRFPYPIAETQKAIADFLDCETARIDQLIEKKQRLVGLFQEKLVAVIHYAVSTAPALESQPLHRFCKIVTGKTPSRSDEDNFDLDEGLLWATPANLGFFEPIQSTKEKLTEAGEKGQVIVPAGTVLVNGIGASIGKIGFAGQKMTFNQQIHGIVQVQKRLADRFLFFVMSTKKDEIVSLASNTTIPIINAERFGRISVPLPQESVQADVVEKVEAHVKEAHQLTVAVTKSIDRLREFRSALITAAVTGQIDVTTWGKEGQTDRRLDQIEEEMSRQEASA